MTHGVLVVGDVHCLSLAPANGREGAVGIHRPQWLCAKYDGDVEVKVDTERGDNHFDVQHVVGVDNPAGMRGGRRSRNGQRLLVPFKVASCWNRVIGLHLRHNITPTSSSSTGVVHNMAIQCRLQSSHLLVGVVSNVCSHKDVLPWAVAPSVGGCSEGQRTSLTAQASQGLLVLSTSRYCKVLPAQIEVDTLQNGECPFGDMVKLPWSVHASFKPVANVASESLV